jgi:hypothetical protein
MIQELCKNEIFYRVEGMTTLRIVIVALQILQIGHIEETHHSNVF